MSKHAVSVQAAETGAAAGRSQPLGKWGIPAIVVGIAVILASLHPWKRGTPPGAPFESTQSVSVGTVTKADVPVTLGALGTVTSLATVTVKSQISGYLTKVGFREGQSVKKGDLLAQVDARTYEVALAQYKGQLEKDKALLDNARRDLARYERLGRQDSISRQTVDTAVATVREYEGTVRMDQAQIDAQKLNLEYCRIASPVDGRAGLRQVDAGNYVTASDTSGIVVITQTDPISVMFTLPEDEVRSVTKRLQAGARLAVAAYDRSGMEKLADGELDTIDNQIDTTTGTVKLRALFKNTDGALFPNQFVNVTLLVDTLRAVLTVPAEAVQTGTSGSFVYMIHAGNTVSRRKITTGISSNGRVVVLSGLEEGDRVVVDGIDRLEDGAKVDIPGVSKLPATTPSAS